MSYTATVERDGRSWMVTVDGVGVTQARHLRELEEMTLDLIDILDHPPGEVTYQFILPSEVTGHLERAAQLREESASAQAAAAAETREAVRVLSEQGLPMRDIGRVLGISHQRVGQLLNA